VILAMQAHLTGQPEGEDTVKNLKTLALAALVAATFGVGGLAAAPSAALAAPLEMIKCSDALKLSRAYETTGDYYTQAGLYASANYYYDKADAIVALAC
jgi:hypothetical protein